MILGLIWSSWCFMGILAFFTFQGCFDYIGDFRGILVIFIGFWGLFLVILEVSWLFWLFYVFWSIYRYFGDFKGMHFD